MKIAIVDYGTGNLRSVGQAVRAVADGADVSVTQSAAEIDAADRVIFRDRGRWGTACVAWANRDSRTPCCVLWPISPCWRFASVCRCSLSAATKMIVPGSVLWRAKSFAFRRPPWCVPTANGSRCLRWDGILSRSAWRILCGTVLPTRAGFILCTAILWLRKTIHLPPGPQVTGCRSCVPLPETIFLPPSSTRKKAPQAA